MSVRYYCAACGWAGEHPPQDPVPQGSILTWSVCPACGEEVLMDAILRKLLARLTPREALVLRERFGLDGACRQVSDVAKMLRIPCARVSAIEAGATVHLWCWAIHEGPDARRVVEEAIGPAPPPLILSHCED